MDAPGLLLVGELLHPGVIVALVVRVKGFEPAVFKLYLEAHLRVPHQIAVLLPVVADGQGRHAPHLGADALDREGHVRRVRDLDGGANPAEKVGYSLSELVKEQHWGISLSVVWLCLFSNTPWHWPTPARGSKRKSRIPSPKGRRSLPGLHKPKARKMKVALARARVSHTLSRPGFRFARLYRADLLLGCYAIRQRCGN